MGAKNLLSLAESFDLFDSWEDRYRYLIDLGQRLPPMDDSLKTKENLVRGCTSQVWLHAEPKTDESGKPYFHFVADSDAQIVKGLIYILILAYQDQSFETINEIDIHDAFDRLGLSGHLSPSRRNGFFSMVEHIKSMTSV
jgi:cysteine desulfuration protein SufE